MTRPVFDVETPLCAYIERLLTSPVIGEEELIASLRDVPCADRIGLCDGEHTFGTIYLACEYGLVDVLKFLLSTIPDEVQRQALEIVMTCPRTSDDDECTFTPVYACIAMNDPMYLTHLMNTHSHIYGPVLKKYEFRDFRIFKYDAYTFGGIVACDKFLAPDTITTVLLNFVKAALCDISEDEYDPFFTGYDATTLLSLCIERDHMFITLDYPRHNDEPTILCTPFAHALIFDVCLVMHNKIGKHVLENDVTEEARDVLAQRSPTPLHVIAASPGMYEWMYDSTVKLLALHFPEWLKKFDDNGCRPCDVEQKSGTEFTTIQRMTISAKAAW